MTESVGDTHEIQKSPYQKACTELAAFKLSLLETVAADPRLSSSGCVQALVVYLRFLTIDKETLQRKPVYASSITLMARAGFKTKTTAGRARDLLAEFGYIKKTGSKTKDGCTWFTVENPHLERIKIHVAEAEEFYKKRDLQRKESDRQKKLSKQKGVSETGTPEARGTRNCYPRVPETDTKYLRGILEGYYHEENLIEDTYTRETGQDFPTEEEAFGPWIERNIPDHHKRREAFRLLRQQEMTPEILRSLAA